MPNSLRSFLPVPWPPPVVSNGENGHRASHHFEPHRVRESLHHALPVAFVVRRPAQRGLHEVINRFEDFSAKGVGSCSVSLLVPAKRLSNVVLGSRRENNRDLAHRAVRRARASAQVTAEAVPERNSALRRRISSAQAFVTVASSSPSKLSINATTKAERSSGPSASASSRRWSTRAFMAASLSVPSSNEASNHSIERTAHSQLRCLRSAAHVER
jgi:hypothetical protein